MSYPLRESMLGVSVGVAEAISWMFDMEGFCSGK